MSSPSSDAPIHFTKEVTWVDSSCCQACGATSWIPWKHHCRACGGCFCQNCSSKSLALPPKHPSPVRVCDKCYNQYHGRSGQPAAKVVGAGGSMAASLPVDFYTRKIDDYSGPKASSFDPMSASVRNFDPAESPKAKWLNDRPASYYYSAPPVDSSAVEAIEGSEDEAQEEEEENKVKAGLPSEKETSSSAKSDATPEAQQEEANEVTDKQGTKDDASGNGDGGEEETKPEEVHQPTASAEPENEASDIGESTPAAEKHPDELTRIEDADRSARPNEPQTNVVLSEEAGEENSEEAEIDAPSQLGEETEVPEAIIATDPSLGELELSGADVPVVDPSVNIEGGSDEASAIDGTSDAVPSSELRSARAPTDKTVMELKEIIKLTEEEDKAEKEKMEAIQNKLNAMQANSFKERLEVGSLAVKELSSSIFYGLRDSLRIKHATISIQKSNRVYNHIIDTVILNGPLLLFMYILFKYVFEPHFHGVLNFQEHRGFNLVLVQIMEFLLKTSFLVLWVGPIYVLSIVLNMQWSQEVGNGAFSLYLYIRRGKTVQKASKPLSDTIAQIIYWQVIFGLFNLLNFLCKFVPVVGPPFYFVCLCWLNAVYCFDYKWGNQKWSLHKKISYCETRWLYFIGFGLPITMATFFFEYIISYSLVSLLFPLFIPMAMYGSPKTQSLWKPIPMSRFLDSSIIAPLIRFVFTLPSQVEKLEQKADTIMRFLVFVVCATIALTVVTYLLHYLVY